MKKHTRLKEFKGLPHYLGGLQYTDDAEVEGKIGKDGKPQVGELGYTPKGSKNEIILRENSRHKKAILKEDAKRSNRDEGDAISSRSFKEAVMPLFLEEFKDLASEGIDPFNGSKDVFATGGRRPSIGSVPTIDDYATTDNGNTLGFDFTPSSNPSLASPQRYDNASIMPDRSTSNSWTNTPTNTSKNAGTVTNNIAGYAVAAGNAAGNLTSSLLDTDLQNEQLQVFDSTADTVMNSIPVVSEFYGIGNSINEPIKDWQADATKRSGANSAEATVATALSGLVDPMDGWSQNAAAYESGALTEAEAAGNLVAQFFLPGFANQSVNRANEKFRESQEKQAGYDATLAERGLIPQSNEVVRNRTQEFKNGGMRKKYSGNYGSVKYNTDPDNPWSTDFNIAPMNSKYNTPYTPYGQPYIPEAIDAENPDKFNVGDGFNTTVAQTDNAYGDYMTNKATSPQGNVPKVADNKKFKFDPNMLTSIAGGLGQMIPSIAYLAGDGKDYDRVKYPTYNPDLVTADLALREARDVGASVKNTAAKYGKLDLGALSDFGVQEAKMRSGIRENVRNVNTGIKNDAQLKNIATMIQQMGDEAANKGQYQTNKYEAMKDIGKGAALGARQYGMMSNDELRKQLIASMTEQRFEELFPSKT